MKKVLLVGVNAKYIHSNPAIYSLKTYAEAYYSQGADFLPPDALHVVEYTINQSIQTVLADLYEKKPDVVAFSCYIWNWEMIQSVIEELPKLLPNIKIWLGGPEVSYHSADILCKYPQITGVVIGEGEQTFTELLHFYETGKGSLEEIRGLQLPEGYTGDRELTNLNQIPFFYQDLSNFQNRIIYYESQRGCPFSCAYCLSSVDKTVRLKDWKLVKKDLDFFLGNRVPQVKFIDRTFNCNAKHAIQIWKYLKEHDNGVTNFHFEIAADLLTKEELEVMSDMRPGLIQLEIGVQSTNEKTLKEINRYCDLKHLQEMVAKVKSFHNIHQHLDLIAGLPYEDYESFRKSFNEVYAMRPQQLQLGFLKVLKGSPMEQRAKEYGLVFESRPAYEVLYTKWLSYDDICRLKAIEEMVEIYYNSNQYTHVLVQLEKEFKDAFGMYEALADYYKEKGLFLQTPSRNYRYQVLLDFAKGINPDKEELFIELLLFDLYLRENCKSRPEFAHDKKEAMELYRDWMREFYQTKAGHYLTDYDGFTSAQIAKMTHMEEFHYAVWDAMHAGERLLESKLVLFDYKKRDALTYDAKYYVLERHGD